MINWLKITCKKATFLIVKSEDTRLSFIEKLQLKLHLGICSFCTKFKIQSKFISHQASHHHGNASLSDEAKEKIASLLK